MFPPTRVTQFFSILARLVWWAALAVGLVLGSASLILHLWIVPRIDDYRTTLAQKASEALGTPVTIGAIRAYSSGVLPSFAMTDVTLFDAKQQPVLKLGTVTVTLSPSSLLALNFEQVTIDQPELDIHRDKDGNIWVAGIDFTKPQKSNSSALDWFFSLNEFRIRDGQVKWTDELLTTSGSTPQTLALTRVGFSSLNPLHRHVIRLDASPPPGWGQAFVVLGQFTQSLIHPDRGRFDQWSGQWFAEFPQIDIAQLQNHVQLDTQVRAGSGAARVWLDVQKGQLEGIQTDLSLKQVQIHLAGASNPLALDHLSGQVDGKHLGKTMEVSTQNLQFQTGDGLVWPGGNVRLKLQAADEKKTESGSITVSAIDLAVVRQLAGSLPLDSAHQKLLDEVAPQGVVQQAEARWQGPMRQPTEFQAKGRVEGLQLAAQAATQKDAVGRPGLTGATLDFDLTQHSGSAKLRIENGNVHFPGVWEDPLVPITQLATDLTWRVTPHPKGEKIHVEVSNGLLSNPDVEGRFTAVWETADPSKSSAKSRFPGVLNLQGKLTRADGARVWRYLPLVVSKSARDYVRLAIKEGVASESQFVLRGDLNDMPFTRPGSGQFLITSKVEKTVLAYVPAALQDPGEAPWPEFSQLSGELIFNGPSLEVRNAKGAITGLPGLRINKAGVKIADLDQPVVKVTAQAQGPLDDMLKFVNQSPLRDLSDRALTEAKATGNADYTLAMTLPVDDLKATQLEGGVKLLGNTLQVNPSTPVLTRSTGLVQFNQMGFQIRGAKATMLGGEVEFEGGSTSITATGKPRLLSEAQRQAEPTISIKGRGQASAQGLQQASELGFVPRFAKFTSGSTAFNMQLDIRHSRPEFFVTSSLQGLAIHLPAPFYKPADTLLPFVFDNRLVNAPDAKKTPNQDTLRIELGPTMRANYLRNLTASGPIVVRGDITIGHTVGEHVPQPASGVGANLSFANLDIDTWSALLNAVSQSGNPSTETSTGKSTGARTPTSATNTANEYLPRIATLRTPDLVWNGRGFQNVVMGLVRDDRVWRANIDAKQLSGYLEFEQGASNPRLFARLSRAQLGAAQQEEVEQVLDDATQSLPALDLEIEEFELAGKSLGKVQVDAINRVNTQGRGEWRLNKLKLDKSFGDLTATGTWSDSPSVAISNAPVRLTKRRMVLNFQLSIDNVGDLLTWAGKPKTVKGGSGKLEGTVAWQGSPFVVNYPTLAGQMALNIKSGQFLQVEPGVAKLLGILSLQALPKLLTLDFRDVFSAGFAFDSITGDVSMDKGVASTQNLQMKGLNALVLMDGSTDLVQETQNVRVVVVPEINAGGVSLAYAAINPAVALGSFITQMVLSGPLAQAATREYLLAGTWEQPVVTEVKYRRPDSPSATPANATTPSTVKK